MKGRRSTSIALTAGAMIIPLLICSCGRSKEIEITLSNGEAAGTIVTIETAPDESLASSVSGMATADLVIADSVTAVQKYYLNYYGTNIVPGDPADQTITQLGTGYELYVGSGSNTENLDESSDSSVSIYTYRDFTLFVSPSANGTNVISGIQITSPELTTREGIRLSDTADNVITTYGPGYTDNGSSICYESGSSRLTFFFTDGLVSDIEYENTGL